MYDVLVTISGMGTKHSTALVSRIIFDSHHGEIHIQSVFNRPSCRSLFWRRWCIYHSEAQKSCFSIEDGMFCPFEFPFRRVFTSKWNRNFARESKIPILNLFWDSLFVCLPRYLNCKKLQWGISPHALKIFKIGWTFFFIFIHQRGVVPSHYG